MSFVSFSGWMVVGISTAIAVNCVLDSGCVLGYSSENGSQNCSGSGSGSKFEATCWIVRLLFAKPGFRVLFFSFFRLKFSNSLVSGCLASVSGNLGSGLRL